MIEALNLFVNFEKDATRAKATLSLVFKRPHTSSLLRVRSIALSHHPLAIRSREWLVFWRLLELRTLEA